MAILGVTVQLSCLALPTLSPFMTSGWNSSLHLDCPPSSSCCLWSPSSPAQMSFFI